MCDKLLTSTWTTSFALLGWRTEVIIALEVFYCKLKQLQPPAGGLFVFQSYVFRINEKLHNVKQGLALTIKKAHPKDVPSYLILQYLFCNVYRSIFPFYICASQILSYYPQHNQLDSS